MRIKLVAMLLLAVMLVTSITACTPNVTDPTGTSTPTGTTATTEDLSIVKDGSSKYSIVYPNYESVDGSESVAHTQAKKIATAIFNATGVELPVVSDNSVSDYEIIVGACNRDEYVAVKRTKNYNIGYNGKKLVLAAGGDEALAAAADAFIEEASGENTFAFPTDIALNYTYTPENAIADGATDVIFAPDILVEYMQVEYSKKMALAFADGNANLFMPNPITLAWTDSGEDEFVVLLSDNSEFKNSINYKVTDPYVDVINLKRNCEYFWKVQKTDGTDLTSVFSFKTSDAQPRTLYIDGVINTRDIGGYVTEDGLKRIKQGMIYRSAELTDITEAGADVLMNVLGVKTQLDLRTASDGEAIEVPILTDRGINYINESITYYQKLFNESKFPDEIHEFRDAIKVFANPENYPIIVHCAIGTDRTGTVAFFIQGLCGVHWKELYREYELSYFADINNTASNPRIDDFTSMYQRLKNYKDKNLSLAENIAAFLLDIGVTQDEIDSIRSIMLEDVQ